MLHCIFASIEPSFIGIWNRPLLFRKGNVAICHWSGIRMQNCAWSLSSLLGHIGIRIRPCAKVSGAMASSCSRIWREVGSFAADVCGLLDCKHFRSANLNALCDASYRFIWVDMGSYGWDNDGTVFGRSNLYSCFENSDTNLPTGNTPLPYVIVGDGVFPLKTWLPKPFTGRSVSERQTIFNYRHGARPQEESDCCCFIRVHLSITYINFTLHIQTMHLLIQPRRLSDIWSSAGHHPVRYTSA